MKYKIRIEDSTYIKLICAFLIFLHHYFQHTFLVHDVMSNCLPLFLFNQQMGYTGVAIFFFLSGYGLMESEKRNHLSFFDFCKRRLYRIYLPFLLVTIIWLPVYYYISSDPIHMKTLIYNALLGGKDPVLWFVKIIIIQYIVFYIYSLIYKNEKFGFVYLLFMTVIVCIIAYYLIGSYSYISIPIFSLGVLYSTYNYRKIHIKDKYTIILVCFAITTSISGYFTQNIIFSFHAIVNYLAILTLLLLIQKDLHINIKTRRIKQLNDASFNIYLVHNKVLFVLIAVGILNIGLYFVAVLFALAIFTSMRKLCKL